MRIVWSVVVSLLAFQFGVAEQVLAQQEDVPPAQTEYMGRRIARTMHYAGAPWLVRESREREEECSTLMKCLELKRNQVLSDLGCGNGFYTLKMAQQVLPEGKVLAVDIQPEMLELLNERAEAKRVTNIEPILGKLHDPNLPEGKLDLILLVDVYHEFSHPQQMIAAMRQSLKPKGRIALVEYRMEDPKVPIKLLHKMTKAQCMKEFTANGMKLVGQFDELPWQHVLFFARDDSPLDEVAVKAWQKPEEPEEPTEDAATEDE